MTQSGFSDDVAEDGREAVKIIKRESEDLDVMDLQMPVIDGCEAMGKTSFPTISSNPKHSCLPKRGRQSSINANRPRCLIANSPF
ncbi:MAG: hypothetical protein MK106_14115 [Mariniblastus sp.]|nr:hypothetical protein [Mariniblastus sp.]